MGTASMTLGFRSSILARLFSLFTRKAALNENVSRELSAAEMADEEIEKLWSVIRQKREGALVISDSECADMITASFNRMRDRFSVEQLDDAYVWLRYVKAAIKSSSKPIGALVEYVSENNYKYLTKRLCDLVRSVLKDDDTAAMDNAESFTEAVYVHILQNVNSFDVPSLLALGRAAQKRKEYAEARAYYTRITEGEEPFNGLTALLACYEEEIKNILSSSGGSYSRNPQLKEKVRELNSYQASVYEKWSRILEDRINSNEATSEQNKKEYVALLTGYARFERSRGNYERAYRLLEHIPRTYPEAYRVYTEEAMLYQFRSYKNRYHSLEKAVETFKKAYSVVPEENSNSSGCSKSKKSILMPLANTYFQLGQLEEASDVCDSVLRIDAKERRAIELKNRILKLAS